MPGHVGPGGRTQPPLGGLVLPPLLQPLATAFRLITSSACGRCPFPGHSPRRPALKGPAQGSAFYLTEGKLRPGTAGASPGLAGEQVWASHRPSPWSSDCGAQSKAEGLWALWLPTQKWKSRSLGILHEMLRGPEVQGEAREVTNDLASVWGCMPPWAPSLCYPWAGRTSQTSHRGEWRKGNLPGMGQGAGPTLPAGYGSLGPGSLNPGPCQRGAEGTSTTAWLRETRQSQEKQDFLLSALRKALPHKPMVRAGVDPRTALSIPGVEAEG